VNTTAGQKTNVPELRQVMLNLLQGDEARLTSLLRDVFFTAGATDDLYNSHNGVWNGIGTDWEDFGRLENDHEFDFDFDALASAFDATSDLEAMLEFRVRDYAAIQRKFDVPNILHRCIHAWATKRTTRFSALKPDQFDMFVGHQPKDDAELAALEPLKWDGMSPEQQKRYGELLNKRSTQTHAPERHVFKARGLTDILNLLRNYPTEGSQELADAIEAQKVYEASIADLVNRLLEAV